MTCICSCVFGCAVFALSGTVVGAFTTQGLPARKYDRDCDQRDERPEGNYERRFQKFTDTVFDFQGCYRPAYAAVQSSTTATRHGLSRSSHQAAFTGCRGRSRTCRTFGRQAESQGAGDGTLKLTATL